MHLNCSDSTYWCLPSDLQYNKGDKSYLLNYIRSIFVSVTELKPDSTYLSSCRITLLNPSCRCRIPKNILPSYVTCFVKTV